MSCIRFSTSAQRRAMAADAAVPAAPEQAIEHRSPEFTDSKLARLRLLAGHASPGIRQSAASSRHAPGDLLAKLAADPEPSVRGEVARNEAVPTALLSVLAADDDARVRSWAALNPCLPSSALAALADDTDAGVRRLAAFRLTPVA